MRDVAVASRRSAAALVRCLGACAVHLRVPAPPVAGDDGEELGLRSPEFQLMELKPVGVRHTAKAVEVLVAAEVLGSLVGVTGPGAVRAATVAADAVVIEDVAYVLTGTEVVEAGGVACLYRLLLEPQGTEVV